MSGGPSNGRKATHKVIRPLRNDSADSLSIKQAVVYEVIVSRRTSINCQLHLITSAANAVPTTGGGMVVEGGGSC